MCRVSLIKQSALIFAGCFISLLQNSIFAQTLPEVFVDPSIKSVYYLNKSLKYTFGWDNHSVDYFSKITENIELVYNKEDEVFYLVDSLKNTISSLDLNKISPLRKTKHSFSVIGYEDWHGVEKTYQICSNTKINNFTNTNYSFGIANTKRGIAILNLSIDTITPKINYAINYLSNIESNLKKFNRKLNEDMFFQSAYNLVNFDSTVYINSYLLLFNDRKKPELVKEITTLKTDLSGNKLVMLDSLKGYESFYYKNKMLAFNKSTRDFFIYDLKLNKCYQNQANDLFRPHKIIEVACISDFRTNKDFLIVKYKLESDSIVYDLLNIKDEIFTSELTINSNVNFKINSIFNNTVFLNIKHPVDKHNYIYKLNIKIQNNTHQTADFHIKRVNNFKRTNQNTLGCNGGGTLSLSQKKILSEENNRELRSRYSKIIIPKESKFKVPEIKQSSINELLSSLNQLIKDSLFSVAVENLFLHEINEDNKTIMDSLIAKQNTKLFESGIYNYNKLIQGVNLRFYVEPPLNSGDVTVVLQNHSGYSFTFIRIKKKWYCDISYCLIY